MTCKYNPSGISHTDACLLSSQPAIPSDIGDLVEGIMEQVENMLKYSVGGLRCKENDSYGVYSKNFEIPDDMNPICYVLTACCLLLCSASMLASCTPARCVCRR